MLFVMNARKGRLKGESLTSLFSLRQTQCSNKQFEQPAWRLDRQNVSLLFVIPSYPSVFSC